MKSDAERIGEFAAWIEGVMRARGYDIDSPRGGGKTRLAEGAGVHRAAITRLLQRQSMPDLETMRGLSRALGIPVRDVLIRSGKLTEQDLPQAPAPPETGTVPGDRALSVDDGQRLPADEVVVVRRGTLPRTTSGKVRRQACRKLYARGELADVTG